MSDQRWVPVAVVAKRMGLCSRTLRIWGLRGVPSRAPGVRLDVRLVGGRWHTTQQAVETFIAAVAAAAGAAPAVTAA
jgi:hypothetical protein